MSKQLLKGNMAIAEEWSTAKLLSMATLGALLAKRPVLPLEAVEQALSDHLPAKKAHLFDSNCRVLQQSYRSAGQKENYQVEDNPGSIRRLRTGRTSVRPCVDSGVTRWLRSAATARTLAREWVTVDLVCRSGN